MELVNDGAEAEPGVKGSVCQLFSVDVEEYFHVNAFDRIIRREDWESYPSRVDQCVGRILSVLADAEATGTFFVLGWLAEKRPHLVREISDAGHEVASHSFWHRRIPTLTAEEFREDLRHSKKLLEDVTGTEVFGYRAPSFSLITKVDWAFDVLLEEGFRYDSSRFPIWRPNYGSPGTPRGPHWVERESGRLLEIPLATSRLAGLVLPSAGGGYLRQMPYSLVVRGFEEASLAGVPAMLYLHPWEIDEDQPRIAAGLLTRIRHYRGLSRTLPGIQRLLSRFRFRSVRDGSKEILSAAKIPWT